MRFAFPPYGLISKSFLVLFFKKELLSSFNRAVGRKSEAPSAIPASGAHHRGLACRMSVMAEGASLFRPTG